MSERDLWQEVLLRAIADAVYGPASVDRRHFLLMCRDARDYLTKPSKDLATVCAMAGMNMQAVIDRMKVQIANAPSPEELMKTPRKIGAYR